MKTISYIFLFSITLLFTNPAKAQDEALTKSMNTVINDYIALKNVLITANGNEAENKAKELLTAIISVPKKGMTGAQLAVWAKYEAKLAFDSRHISEVNHVDHQREHFGSLSTSLYAVLKAFSINSKPLYYEYCTMNKQYYLSEVALGKDPYMGMALCSKVKDTLPAK